MRPIPLVDLARQHAAVADEVAAGFARVMEASAFILGEDVAKFERRFAAYTASAHCVGVANGTDALELALRAMGAAPGDEVILPANTFVATALAVARAGARPVLVDCDEDYQLIDPGQAAARIGRRTRAVVPVHLFGQMADMPAIAALGLPVVEDAAQAHGATQDARAPGAGSLAACYSFYPGKNLGAYGDGGAVTTNDEELATRLQALRNYGSDRKYHHPVAGFNSRLDTLQAVVLNAKLAHLDRWNAERVAAARRYDELLRPIDAVRCPRVRPGNAHVFHIYAVRVPRRDEVLQALHSEGIGAGIHYPTPIHLCGAFRDLGHREGDFPVAEKLARETLSLPLFPGITQDEQVRVAEALQRALAR